MSDLNTNQFMIGTQGWIMLCIALATGAMILGSQISAPRAEYVTRNEYQAAMSTLHEEVTEVKSQISSLDMYVRQNLPPMTRHTDH